MRNHTGKRPRPRRTPAPQAAPRQRRNENPAQLLKQHLLLAGEASRAGDDVRMEHHYQHAEHYYRTLNGEGEGAQHSSQSP